MLEIREDSFTTLDRDFRRRYHEEIYGYLAQRIPDTITPRPKADVMLEIEASHRRANERGIESSDDIVRFTTLWMIAGRNFDNQPAVDEYLASTDWSMTKKLDRLLREVGTKLDH
ncbi:MAG: hypothetical protein KF873_07395 [Gemmataceae bacterium]|nr:hypothetical protein [Planctomycetia bacterium]MBX3398545.1 hypothetical protein [Gemmataceae bacterium]